jgi:hypothetical protein
VLSAPEAEELDKIMLELPKGIRICGGSYDVI